MASQDPRRVIRTCQSPRLWILPDSDQLQNRHVKRRTLWFRWLMVLLLQVLFPFPLLYASSLAVRRGSVCNLLIPCSCPGCVSVLRALLRTPARDPQAGVDPNGRRPPSAPSSGRAGRCSTLLHTAAAQGHRHREAVAGVVKLLIEAGASPSLPDQSGATPLHIAARRGPVGMSFPLPAISLESLCLM